jgi:hypothetical protein
MNTKNVPAIIMLAAGLVASIVMFLCRYRLVPMLGTLLGVFAVFYLLGLVVKKMLDRFCQIEKTEEENENEEPDGGENPAGEADGENAGSADGSVIEK